MNFRSSHAWCCKSLLVANGSLCCVSKWSITSSRFPVHLHEAPGQGQEYGRNSHCSKNENGEFYARKIVKNLRVRFSPCAESTFDIHFGDIYTGRRRRRRPFPSPNFESTAPARGMSDKWATLGGTERTPSGQTNIAWWAATRSRNTQDIRTTPLVLGLLSSCN